MPQRPPSHRPQRLPPRDDRLSAHARGYTRQWRKAREAWLNAHPLCVHCQAKGRLTAAVVVDHVVPHQGNDRLFWDTNNWQSLCKPCHDIKTATLDGGFGNHGPRG